MSPLTLVDEAMTPVLLLVGGASLLLIPVSFAVFARMLRSGPFHIALPGDLARLRAALIMHWAMIEMPCMLNVVLLLITNSAIHTALATASLAVLALRGPSLSRLLRWSMGNS